MDLIIHHVLSSLAVGGAETLVASLAEVQRRQGHHVVVHSLRPYDELRARLQAAGIPAVMHPPGRPLSSLLRLLAAFRRARPHVVHLHNISPAVVGAPAARLARVPCRIVTRHGGDRHSGGTERKFWLAARLCHRVVVVSQSAAERLALAPWALRDRLVLIRNGAAPPEIPAGPPPRKEPSAAFTLVSVGRLHPVKDYPSLLRAVALAAAELPSLRLWILGDGPDRPALENLVASLGIARNVELLGLRQDVGCWLAQADAFVLASVTEGLPLALLEAFAAGLPAIVTASGGMPEVVGCCGAGVVVPPSQPEALACAILALARDPQRLGALRERARQCYAAHFTFDRMVADYFRLYLDVLAGKI